MKPASSPISTETSPESQLSWQRKLLMLFASVILLSLALAPLHLFPLAWIGLVPWLIVVRDCRRMRSAFLWSWLGGTLFFAANMWWLWKVTIPGMFVLHAYLGLYFGFAAIVFRGCGLIRARSQLQVAGAILMMAIAWVALEYVRGNWSMFGNQGLPWLNLGATQSKFLLICQTADLGGVYATSFIVMVVNAAFYFAWENRRALSVMVPSIISVGLLLIVVTWYGITQLNWLIKPHFGPTVLVVQPNIPQSNSGEKGAPRDEIVRFHLETTKKALEECKKDGRKVDLVVWSETMMPPINQSARETLRTTRDGEFLQQTYDAISDLAATNNVGVLCGVVFSDQWEPRDQYIVSKDRRNSAFYFERTGMLSAQRYDKVHLVPFGEFIPYQSIPPIYNFLIKLGPAYYEDYVLTPGAEDANPTFTLDGPSGEAHSFVVPICFEDIVGPDTARMVRGDDRKSKRAQFLVNITNDGWFGGFEQEQHIDAAIFRSIENRTPTARAVNTGVSGFIDSVGRIHDTVPPHTVGWSAAQLTLDPRVTFYTLHGDAFAYLCAGATSMMVVSAIVQNVIKRKSKGKAA